MLTEEHGPPPSSLDTLSERDERRQKNRRKSGLFSRRSRFSAKSPALTPSPQRGERTPHPQPLSPASGERGDRRLPETLAMPCSSGLGVYRPGIAKYSISVMVRGAEMRQRPGWSRRHTSSPSLLARLQGVRQSWNCPTKQLVFSISRSCYRREKR